MFMQFCTIYLNIVKEITTDVKCFTDVNIYFKILNTR